MTHRSTRCRYLRSAHANRHAEARVSRCMNTRHAEGQVNVEVSYGMAREHATGPMNCREVPQDCPEEKQGSFRVLISPDQFIHDIEVGFWDLTSRYQDEDLEGIKGVPEIGDGFQARIARPNLVVVLVVVCRSLLPQMPPASPIEDRGTAIPIEDRDRAIPERLRLCGAVSPTNEQFYVRHLLFNAVSVMSCPYISGIAGLLKTRYPSWSSAAICSAIMTIVPKDCPEEKEGSFQVLICPDQFIQEIEAGFLGLTSRYQDKDLEGIKRVPDIGGGYRARIARPV
ncbi:hypothetical protein DY000_02023131 [Brassica cretica]|uniref:Peptidase S8/S53 domain-containing protein n=1 Tax=Brassica cretica TaxID=69181 RepID=A0ABQ7E8A0_BRACR|nr:hypothetical protein DY000_02023131 [Brassica cretica]